MKILEGSVEELIAYAEWHEAHEKRIGLKDRDLLTTIIPKCPKRPTFQCDKAILPDEGRSSSLGHSARSQTILPTRPPSKERTVKLEAIFRDYIKVGLNAMAIQEHLIKEHDIAMNGHQIAGWMGRMKQQETKKEEYRRAIKKVASQADPRIHVDVPHMTKKADKTNLEGNCLSPEEKPVKEPITKPDEMVTTKSENVSKTVSPLTEPDKTIWYMYQKGNMDIDIKYKLDRMGHPMKVRDIRTRIDEMKVKA